MDRLREAEYFLGLLKAAPVESDDFRYLCSAAITAIRSISLVLQKDLKGKAPGFDSWFEQWKLRANKTRFDEIIRLRNTLQKRGNEYPLLCYTARTHAEPVAFVHFRYCAADSTRPLRSFAIQLSPDHAVTRERFPGARTGAKILTGAEHAAAVALLSRMQVSLSDFELTGVVIDSDPESPVLHPAVFLQRLEEVLDDQRELTMSAMETFGVLTPQAPIALSGFTELQVIVPAR